nr:PREDICTED: uncharacterized protein LOC109434688 [Rhinolophus sinicus]
MAGAGTEIPEGLFPGITGQVASSCPPGAVSEYRTACFRGSHWQCRTEPKEDRAEQWGPPSRLHPPRLASITGSLLSWQPALLWAKRLGLLTADILPLLPSSNRSVQLGIKPACELALVTQFQYSDLRLQAGHAATRGSEAPNTQPCPPHPGQTRRGKSGRDFLTKRRAPGLGPGPLRRRGGGMGLATSHRSLTTAPAAPPAGASTCCEAHPAQLLSTGAGQTAVTRAALLLLPSELPSCQASVAQSPSPWPCPLLLPALCRAVEAVDESVHSQPFPFTFLRPQGSNRRPSSTSQPSSSPSNTGTGSARG